MAISFLNLTSLLHFEQLMILLFKFDNDSSILKYYINRYMNQENVILHIGMGKTATKVLQNKVLGGGMWKNNIC